LFWQPAKLRVAVQVRGLLPYSNIIESMSTFGAFDNLFEKDQGETEYAHHDESATNPSGALQSYVSPKRDDG
jgi:hypothetical protein